MSHTPTVSLTDKQISFFHENGYLAIDNITTDEEVARMREAYDLIFEQRAGRDEGMEFDLAGTDEEGKVADLPQILDPRRYSEKLRDTLYEANALHISRQLLGEGVRARGSHAIFKPAKHGAPTPWHQDEAYWNPSAKATSLSVWMPLQEATRENGCMEFIPKSHLRDVQPHHHIDNNPKIHGLEVDDGIIDPSQAVACPLPQGGATFHLSRTFHYTAPNNSQIPRRAFILGFGLESEQLDEPRDFYWQRVTETYAGKKREETARAKEERGSPSTPLRAGS